MAPSTRCRVVMALLAGALAGGCGGVVGETWVKPGTTTQMLNRDVAACEREASVDPTHGQEQGAYGFSVRKDDRAFTACMRARGYEPRTS